MKKVGILYICTGKYSLFWKNFFEQTEKLFLPKSEKHYFLFTDNKELLSLSHERVHPYEQELEPWPFPTLKRFEYFLRAKNELLQCDYLYFMNANLLIQKKVREWEFLPRKNEKLVVALHPGFYNKSNDEFPYDRNPECSACIPFGSGERYVMGALNGGRAKDFVLLMEALSASINADLQKNVIALWHDESALNRYIFDYTEKYRVLSPSYLYPEGWKLPFRNKMMLLDKSKLGGHDFLRNIEE